MNILPSLADQFDLADQLTSYPSQGKRPATLGLKSTIYFLTVRTLNKKWLRVCRKKNSWLQARALRVVLFYYFHIRSMLPTPTPDIAKKSPLRDLLKVIPVAPRTQIEKKDLRGCFSIWLVSPCLALPCVPCLVLSCLVYSYSSLVLSCLAFS
jgi:hypothetical protein